MRGPRLDIAPMGTRTRALATLIGIVLLAAACGSTGSDSAGSTTSGPSTTVSVSTTAGTDETTTTEAETTTTEDGGTTATTEGSGTFGPTGDEKIVPLLLEPKDFGSGLVADDSSDDAPDKKYCDGVSFTVDWQATASMSAKGDDEALFVGASESVIDFAPGVATKFMKEFVTVNTKCSTKENQSGLVLKALPGFGDEALRGAPTEENATPSGAGGIEVVLVRVGDEVIVLFGLFSTEPLLTDALINKAVAKVEAGG